MKLDRLKEKIARKMPLFNQILGVVCNVLFHASGQNFVRLLYAHLYDNTRVLGTLTRKARQKQMNPIGKSPELLLNTDWALLFASFWVAMLA